MTLPPPPGHQPPRAAVPPPPGWAPGQVGSAPPPGHAAPPPGHGPPPGYGPPPGFGPTPGYGPPPGWRPPPVRAVHKPGAIPLQPLTLSDIYGAAFKIVRHNPQATAGAALLVTLVAMTVPTVLTLAASLTDVFGTTNRQLVEGVVGGGSLLLGLLLNAVGTAVVAGMVVSVCRAAAVGRTMTLGQAWAATHGSRWRLVGLSALSAVFNMAVVAVWVAALVVLAQVTDVALVVLVALVSGAAVLVLLAFVWIRLFYLAGPVLVMERRGVFASLGRGWQLSRGDAWRVLGIAVLTMVVVQFASGLVTLPVGLGFGLLSVTEWGVAHPMLVQVLSQSIGAVLASVLVTPFVACVTSLQYLDERFRKEALDVDLMTEAGILTP